jgi:PEP-CTERM motif
MKFIRTLSAAACLLAAAPAFAANTLIDFEGVTSFASVADFYNGGTDGNGAAGTNLGASFTGAALALSNDELGPYFSHAPSPGTVMFATDSSALLNFGQGFVDELSFYYSASSSAFDVVTIYSGLDGSGSVLGSISLTANAQLGGCNDAPFCNWQRVALSFAGTGKSIGFGGNAGNVAFDNIAITAVPEPESYAMLAMGLAGVILAVRRQRHRA